MAGGWKGVCRGPLPRVAAAQALPKPVALPKGAGTWRVAQRAHAAAAARRPPSPFPGAHRGDAVVQQVLAQVLAQQLAVNEKVKGTRWIWSVPG